MYQRRYTGSTYDLMNACGAVRLRTGAIPRHRCSWGCGAPSTSA
ncbi:hypothetical protein ACWEQW_05760 [Streptomyces nigra]